MNVPRSVWIVGLLGGLLLSRPAPATPPVTPPGMIYIPGASFLMGGSAGAADEAPAHRVTLSPYFIDQKEVTIKAFAAFVRLSQRYDSIEGPW